MITESIGTQLTTVLTNAGVSVNLSEAETGTYPYVVYESSPEPVMTKDGVVGYRSDVIIRVFAQDFDTADTKAALIVSALETNMRSASYCATLRLRSSECVDGLWTIELQYNIRQY